jgi:adenylate kinase family enzyme
MRKAQILFCDVWLPRGFIGQLLAKANHLEAIVIRDLFREALNTADTLKDEIKSYVDKGEIVPIKTVERLILWGIQHRPRFLLIGYPRSVEQFESFMQFCMTHAINIDKLWYFKTEDFVGILNDTSHFSKLHWSEEETDEYKQKRLSDHNKFRDVMNSFVLSHKQLWHVVPLNRGEFTDEALITSKISNKPL